MAFNENTRVKIPAILHLCKLGYEYVSLKTANWDEGTNIFTDIFAEGILHINPYLEASDVKKIFEDVSLKLDNEDLGEEFFGMLTTTSGIKLKEVSDYQQKRQLTASLILHDIGTKDERKQAVEDFKDGKIDLLFVYNMLLTGFDAKRLKKLYIGRKIKDHNLLQTLTRVNRPYKKFRYGYVVDFADIRSDFERTNQAYLNELQAELGNEFETYSNLFKSKDEIETEIRDIKESLFHYDLKNAEEFSRQSSQIEDRQTVLEIKKALQNARNLYNIIRLYGHFDLLDNIDFRKLNDLYNETARHLDLLNLKESLKNNVDNTNLLNVALENIIFMFRKVSEEEMIIADQLKDMLRKTREGLAANFDKKDDEFVSLYEELKRLF